MVHPRPAYGMGMLWEKNLLQAAQHLPTLNLKGKSLET